MKKFIAVVLLNLLSIQSHSAPYWNWSHIDISRISFPSFFKLGVTNFAYEIEGNSTNTTCHVYANKQAGIACDHWNRYQEDIELMNDCGITSCCFSLEWAKIEPAPGVFDLEVLQHYFDECSESIRNGIQPIINLKDFRDPVWFIDMGGFEKQENIAYFEQYCMKVFEVLQGQVQKFITFWTPESYAMLAYWNKSLYPFKHNLQTAMKVLRNQLDAHVRVYQAIKKIDPKTNIGIVKHIVQIEPSSSWLDRLRCSIANKITNTSFYNFFTKGSFDISIPLLPGKWGGAVVHYKNPKAPQSIDFIGVNYHSHTKMKNGKLIPFENDPKTELDNFTVYPEGLYYAIQDISDKLAKQLSIPIIVTFSGIATIDDELRKQHNERSLYAVSKAIKDGYNVIAYHYYSLLDGFAWGGYEKHFGLFLVNRDTMERTLKSGAQRFIEIAQQHKNKI